MFSPTPQMTPPENPPGRRAIPLTHPMRQMDSESGAHPRLLVSVVVSSSPLFLPRRDENPVQIHRQSIKTLIILFQFNQSHADNKIKLTFLYLSLPMLIDKPRLTILIILHFHLGRSYFDHHLCLIHIYLIN